MVGMSGKSGETRRTGRTGGASLVAAPGNKKLDQQPQPAVVKPKASAEQVNIANILGDSNALPTNMEERIAQVMAVVSSKSEEEVTIALHDNDYCVETAIDTLLDSASDLKDVWSQPVSRKNKKKSLVENDPLAVLADTTTSSSSSKTTAPHGAGNPSRVTPRAAAQHTRENYGGTVTVVEHPPRGAGRGGGRDRGRSQSSGRSRKEKGENKSEREGKDGEGKRGKGDHRGERGDDYKSEQRGGGGGRESSGGGNGGRRDRGERGDRRSNGGSRSKRRDAKSVHNKEGGANNSAGSASFSRHRHTKERWSIEPAVGEEAEQQQPKEQEQLASNTAVWFTQPQQDVWQSEVSLNPQQWSADPIPATQSSTSVFPEALLAQPTVTTPPVTPPVTTREEREEPISKGPPTKGGKGRSRSRKYLPSQIPSEPVEMPSGVDTVSLRLSNLGIDFMSREVPSPTVTETTPSTHQYESSSLHSPQPLLANPVPSGGALLPTPSYPSTFPTDSSVLPIPPSLESASSGYHPPPPAAPVVTSHTEAPPTSLEHRPPPGLTHPSKHSDKSTASHLQQGLLPEPLALPTHSTQATPTDMLSSHIPSAPKPSLPQLPTPSASYPSPLGSMSLQPETTPTVKMPQASGGSYTAPSPSTTSATIPHTSSEPLFTNKPPPTNVPTVAARQHHTGGPTNTASSSAGGLISASSVNPQRSSGKQHGGNVQHPMMYQPAAAPGMLPYYTHAPPVVMPPPYAGAPYTDMESMNRYPFYAQHATSQEQAASSMNRDHVSSSYATDAASKQLDMATAISSSALTQQQPQQQQQQQQGALQHPYYYPHPTHSNMALYSLYAQMQAQAAQFQMGHKPGVTTTFATSYQHNPQFSGLTGYDDGAAAAQDYKHFPGGSSLGKSSNVPSTSTATDFQQQFKYDKQQQQAGYGYPMPHQSTTYLGGPAFMPIAPLPHLPGPLMTTPHETSSRPKHGKTPYMGQSNTLFN